MSAESRKLLRDNKWVCCSTEEEKRYKKTLLIDLVSASVILDVIR